MINKAIVYILVALLMTCTVTNCCDSKLITEYSFTKDDLKINPYTGTETLEFIGYLGQTITFSSGTRSSVTQTLYKNVNNYNENCKGDYSHAEANLTTFTSNDDSLKFELELYFNVNSPVVRKAISFISQNVHIPVAVAAIDAYFDNDTIYMYSYGPSYSSDSSYTYHESIKIGNKLFNNIYEIHLIPQALSTVTKFYYSQKNGIVGFDTQHKGIWYLDKIIK
jgi:hypothetical protein